MNTGKDLYSTFQAAKVLGVSPDTVLKWIKAGKLPASRTLGGHYRIRRDTIAELLSKKPSTYSATQTLPLLLGVQRRRQYVKSRVPRLHRLQISHEALL
jgi:excisionase family DNA binding protein